MIKLAYLIYWGISNDVIPFKVFSLFPTYPMFFDKYPKSQIEGLHSRLLSSSNSGQLEALVLTKGAVVTLLPESRSDCNRGDTILHHGGLRSRKLGHSSSKSDWYDDVKLATVSDWSLTHCIVRRIFKVTLF